MKFQQAVFSYNTVALSALMMEAVNISKTSDSFYQTTRRNTRREYLKSHQTILLIYCVDGWQWIQGRT
jgi:hypothetical protein